MSCYVDDVEHPFLGMLMCHLWADSLDELLEMVDRIGVERKWIQGHPTLSFGKHRTASWVHFDIPKGKRARAIGAGAILTDRYGPLEHCARLQIASGDPQEARRGESRLALIDRCRENEAAGVA